ncbi:hypothetical protein FBD94_14675 [Pedobacter hiemivivus]|uniref:Sel1 repeat family protein n=1 Tax=Pedobacter hiemivivus TaxID=2530454 RepID=A0A4V5PCF8_9SPHI|nr:hypothetical protein [Pedobacter hiemivivus]TKC60156.1 hypothetical protein FBD94_14675 [Pedobacter hiemivivus]
MKTTSFILICLMLILLVSCNNEKKRQFVPEIPTHTKLILNKEETIKLWKKAIDEGDFKAYANISNAYLMNTQIYELYYYSLIMTNKYNCPQAYYHLFTIMNDKVSIDGLKLYSNDEATRNMSLYYLLRAKELGYTQAQFEIDDVFGKGKSVPKSSYFIQQLLISQNLK